MLLITPDIKLADAIHSNYLLIPVVTRFGIRLGFGEKTVQAVCDEHGVDAEFFTTILNVFSHESYFPQERMLRFNALQLVEYLKKTHDYYRSVLIPMLDRNLELFLRSAAGGNEAEVSLIESFFAQYKNELTAHLKREEELTFPYIEGLYHRENLALLHRQYSMKVFESEHDNVDEKLYDLKNILIKYLQGDYSEGARNSLMFDLFRLEKDLKDHTRIEEKILAPMVKKMEQEVFGKAVEQLKTIFETFTQPACAKDELSGREREVLAKVAQGAINKEIADSLHISLSTVITHRKNITAKLGIKTISGLTVYAILNGIISERELPKQ
jgi:regulator of cell morphogenesis and NO signaling